MSVLKPLPHSFDFKANIAGKVFILGEYAVLSGLPAVIATVGPRFQVHAFDSQEESDFFPAASPIGRLISWASSQGAPRLSFRFEDPFCGEGGFGASSAQFALAYLAFAERMNWERRWENVWKLYSELMASDVVPPSGADIVAQWRGGVAFFDPSDRYCLELWPIFDWSRLLVFSATGQSGRKTPTHEHLKTLVDRDLLSKESPLMKELERVLIRGISAIQEGDVRELGSAMDEYAGSLSRFSLEVERTREDRLLLRELPGVAGVKGTGALQSDGIIVLMEPSLEGEGLENRNQVISMAESRGLRLVADGLSSQVGISQVV